MREDEWMTARFEEYREHLGAVAYRMLGSLSEAEDAVQEAWLRLHRSDIRGVGNLKGWLTTVVGRVCLDMLRVRRARREETLGAHLPEPVANPADGSDPEHEMLLADAVGLALLVVLETLRPAERLAFVLHDLFAIGFDEIAPLVERSPEAARQLASRARRRVRGTTRDTHADLARQHEVVHAFLAAARGGDFNALVALLDPGVVLRMDSIAVGEVRGASNVAGQALAGAGRARFAQPALVNGAAGIVVAPRGKLLMVLCFTVADGRIAAIDVVSDPARLRQIKLAVLSD